MDVKKSSIENNQHEETGTADGTSRLEKGDIDLNAVDNRDTINDGVVEREKVTSQVEQPLLGDGSDWEDPKSVRSSNNSKSKSESSRDYHKQWDGFEGVQDPQSIHLGSIRRQSNDNELVFHRREHDGGKRDGMVIRSRENSYPRREPPP